MFKKINDWLESVFYNSDINKLLAVTAVGAVFVWLFAGEIAPLFGGLLIAYLLDGVVQRLERDGVSRTTASALLVILSSTVMFMSLGLLPLFFIQLRGVVGLLPDMQGALSILAGGINAYLPESIEFMTAEDNIAMGLTTMRDDIGKFLLDHSVNIAVNVFSLFLYMVLLPLLVFFMLKDKNMLLESLGRYLPRSPIFAELWVSMDGQIGSYIRGKFIEAGILGVMSWAAFAWFDMNYAFSLAALMGLSVFVPFVGAIAVTFPVLALAYIQFGGEAQFYWILIAYTLIQAFDGQILVPLLFSEVVKLHPVAIFTAIIFFGGIWGVWGVFFAIPLASIVKSVTLVINARRSI